MPVLSDVAAHALQLNALCQDRGADKPEVKLEASTAPQGLTDAEQAVIKLAGQFARDFAELPQLHPADIEEEVAFHVHALARIVGMRAAHRWIAEAS